MTQPYAHPPHAPMPPKPDLGRAGCLPASLAAAPFLLMGIVCLVIAVIAFTTPTPPRPRNDRGTIPTTTTTVVPDGAGGSTTTTEETP
jgi:hypothetical protein